MAQIRPYSEGFQAECHDLPVAVRAPSLQQVVTEVRTELSQYLANGKRPDLSAGEPPLILFALQFAPYSASEY